MAVVNVLVADSQYKGKYVAMPSFIDKTVVAAGENPSIVLRLARKLGIQDPVVFYVPEPNMTHIY